MSTAQSRSPIQESPPEAAASKPRGRVHSNEARTLTEIVNAHFDSLASHVAVVLETGDEEGIHKLRVATRKLQAVLDLLQSGSDELHIRRFKKQLRKLRGVLSTARNYDVFRELVQREAAHSGPVRRRQNEWIAVEIESRRAKYLIKVNARLRKFPIQKMGDMFRTVNIGGNEAAASKVGDGSTELSRFPESRVAQRAAERLEQRTVELQEMAAAVNPGSSPVDVHELRKAAKRLRYLLETLSQMGYARTSKVVNWLKQVQDRIGDWHDLHSLEEEVIDMVAREKFLREHMRRGGGMLQAGAHMLRRKSNILQKTLPLKVPSNLGAHSKRLLKALRRRAADGTFITAIK